MFLLSLSIALIFVSIPTFLYKFMVVSKVFTIMVVQITHLIFKLVISLISFLQGCQTQEFRLTHNPQEIYVLYLMCLFYVLMRCCQWRTAVYGKRKKISHINAPL